ncbi:hypothetical protein GCM10010302_05620 [Streptomyces polychromogenes]|uniref:Integrase catalytic domain-containing protein n=1 Tax=Streptomyces polychromogenes TaxID=67342 RepID=A0ABP3ERH7_9ACTN
MRDAGLAGRHRRRGHRTTIADPAAARRPDLVMRDFTADPQALDTRWCGDITYIPTGQGWLYLATVIDIASRRVIGWAPPTTSEPAWPPTHSPPPAGNADRPGR